jgi:hypothetical protein
MGTFHGGLFWGLGFWLSGLLILIILLIFVGMLRGLGKMVAKGMVPPAGPQP